MTETELLKLIHDGENIRVEFKKSTHEITKDVYDTVCSFSNRDGGIIFLGVKDNGEILGIAPDAVDRMKTDFVTSINNGQKINPPLYLQPETHLVDGRTILVIQVPVSSQVCRHHGRIFDRNHESDIDITDSSDMVYQLYARKSGSYFINKVTRFQLDDLRSDLMERARAMTSIRSSNHPWKSMSDEEMLRSAGLILKDDERQLEGITLAAILLFGKDSTIMSVLPQHKTDAIFRVENLDRYDAYSLLCLSGERMAKKGLLSDKRSGAGGRIQRRTAKREIVRKSEGQKASVMKGTGQNQSHRRWKAARRRLS